MLDLIISLCGSCDEPEFRGWELILLEIVFYILKDRSIHDINAKTKGSGALEQMLAQEKAAHKAKSSRHARFGGAFSVKTNSGNQMTTHKLSNSISQVFDAGKKSARIVRKNQLNGKPVRFLVQPKSREAYCYFLDQFVQNGLSSIFILM